MLSLWQMSLSASAVILLATLLRRWAANRLPRRMYIALWDVALLAGIVPFRVPWEALSQLMQRAKTAVMRVNGAALSAPLQTPHMAQITSETMTAAMPGTPLPISVGDIRGSLTQAVQPLRETVQAAPDWLWRVLGVLWVIGAVVLATVLLIRWVSCLRVFSEALPCEDPRIASFLRQHRTLRLVRVRVSGRIGSPLSYGLLRPVMLLPAAMAGADDQTLSYVLTHEFMHIRAWDMLRKEAMLLMLCLHWFNPLVWVMLRLYSRDMELMCDERVVRRLGGRKAYCLTLLDMEARRSNLTMGTCFSVTGIEERIKVMKNRKQQGILSIALALAIFLGAAVGAITGIPLAGAENASPRMMFSRESWENIYAKYEIYGLGYDEKNGTITYNGNVVRYFEDMWPIDEQGKAGNCFMVEGGTVDVYGVREFPEYIRRNPDGSFDPSGTLIGLREATKEEYDEFTARQAARLSPGTLTEYMDAYQLSEATVISGDAQIVTAKPMDVEWWTADEFREWMEEERIALQELVDEQASAWTPSTGWFTWTQERADEAMARYESILQSIEQGGAFVSKRINGMEGNMVLMQGLGHAGDVPPVDSVSDAAVVTEEMNTILFSQNEEPLRYEQEPDTTLQSYETLRIETWRETIAPYAPFGLSYALDTAADLVHLYWNGREVRGVFDPQLGVWITEHAGNSYFPDGAKELIAVYENGVLIELREADAEESAVWDKLREENTKR